MASAKINGSHHLSSKMFGAMLVDSKNGAQRLLTMKNRNRFKLLRHYTAPSNNGVEDSGENPPSLRMEGTNHKQGMKSGSATGVGSLSSGIGPLTSGVGPASASASRSVSLASVSSDGSSESHLVEQEDIVALTQEVRAFKEALGKLRRLFHPDKEKCESLRVAAHERLGEVLRILRIILERYPALQSTELLVAAGSLIHQVKEHHYEDEKNDVKEFMESIDQLALAFSSRVSEYLMGDLDSNISLASSISSKTKSCENLPSDVESTNECRDGKDTDFLSGSQMDAILIQLEQGVEVALHRAKLWSKYAKDIMSYVEKRCNLEMEFAKNVTKLAQTMRSALKEECYLPFQSIYITAMDREIDNCNSAQTTCSLLTGHKFLEPLSARRNEHERCRKQLKEIWHRELKRMQEAVSNLRKAKSLYIQRQQEWERAKDAAIRAENAAEVTEQAKIDKRKKLEDDALQKAMEAETTYKACVSEANERHGQLLRVKGQVLQQVRELMLQCDQTMKAVTVSYFQLQHTVSAPAPVQFQTLCESSRLYEPGSQYMEFIRRMPLPNRPNKDVTSSANSTIPNLQGHSEPFSFEPYSEESASVAMLEKERKSNGSLSADSSESTSKERVMTGPQSMPIKAWSTSVSPHGGLGNVSTQVNSDTESVESSPSAKSRDTSPTASPMMPARRLVPASSGDELENEQEQEADGSYLGYSTARRHLMSKAAVSHTFRKLKTPSRCRECDSYVYFQGAECIECGLACHKKCLESLAIQCGHKRLPRKMTTFGVDLSQHLVETGTHVPHLLAKCISEIDARGIQIKGLYRVSGVKSKVEKLCQAFENGADLVDLTDIHPNVIANVLKLYLRQLPEPLLTSRLYPEFIKVAKESPVNTVEELRDLCHKLPRHHYSTLAYLMHHLKRVSLESESNNMPPSNLGIVFGPTLLRTSEGSASLSSLVDTVHQTKVIELLIIHTDEIFGPVENIHNSKENRSHVTKGEESSILSKVPVVRSISFLEKHRKSRDSETIVSTPADRRGEVREEVILPGFVVEHKPISLEIDPLASEEGLLSPTSDDDLPDFLLPDDSSKTRKLPYFRPGSAPKVFKGSLKDYHGLEGVDLNSLSNQDQESHPHLRVKKSFSDLPVHGTAVNLHPNYSTVLSDSTLPSLSSISGGDSSINSSAAQSSSSQVKMIAISNAPFMDSSIDSDHSWESHSTGSSGRGTQHSDQGSLGSAQKAHLLSINNDRDETDGRLDSLFTSMSSVSRNDENRVKIQVPSAVPVLPMTAKEIWNTSSSSASITSKTAESHGVVTVLEGPTGSTTLVDSLSKTITDQSKSVLVGGGRGNVAPSAGTNITGSVLVSELASIPTGLTHEFAHVFRSVKSVTTTTTTVDSNSRKTGERFPRFV